jgi:hypothetical protein
VKAERTEGIVQVLILITVAGMAGAGSFTHVHDWTMRNVPAGTGSWLGWANAVITELVPAAAGIEIRRRKRQHRPVTYPMTILIADAVISIAVQLSDAIHTLAGGLAFALPALAFLALTKLILSAPRTSPEGEPGYATTASTPNAHTQTAAPAPAAATHGTASTTPPAVPALNPTPTPTAAPAAVTPPLNQLHEVPPGQLLISARMAAYSHQQDTGTPITSGELADRMNIPPALAESLLDHLDGTPPPVTAASGTAMNGSRP